MTSEDAELHDGRLTHDHEDTHWWVESEAKRRLVTIGVNVREARTRGGLTIDELARRSGLHYNTVGRIERGQSEGSTEQLLRIAMALQVDPDMLWSTKPSSGISGEGDSQFALIDEIDVRASAGHGALNGEHEVVGKFAFSRDWLRKKGLRQERCRIIRAKGNSMSSRINDGDILLIDIETNQMDGDGVYVIEMDGMDYVKVLQKDFSTGGVRVVSYNPDYPPQLLDASKADGLRISGKVVWHGGDI